MPGSVIHYRGLLWAQAERMVAAVSPFNHARSSFALWDRDILEHDSEVGGGLTQGGLRKAQVLLPPNLKGTTQMSPRTCV